MAFCPNCGAQATGSFCPNCGAALTGAGVAGGPGPGYPPPPPPPGGAPGYAPPPMGSTTSGLSEGLASALCYCPFAIGLICEIVFLVAEPYNKNRTIRFHAFQGLFLHLAIFVLSIVFGIVNTALLFMTHLATLALFPLMWLAVLVLLVFMMVKSYQGQMVKLPVIGDLAAKQA